MTVPERLSHLLELANKGPALRAALAEEVAEMLMAWPADCPPDMRLSCEGLLAQAAREVAPPILDRLRQRLAADPNLSARLLPQERRSEWVALARRGNAVAALVEATGVSQDKAAELLADRTGRALANACRNAGVGRAEFSTMALLSNRTRDLAGAYARLDAYDGAPAQ
jgi:hypothetical protein